MAKDYVLRLIDQVAMMLAEIVARRKGGDRDAARREIEDQALQHTGLPLSVIRNATPDLVADLLRSGGELRYIRSVLLAELLVQDAEISEETGAKPEALVAWVHALRLYHDSIASYGAGEREHFQGRIGYTARRIRALSDELGVDPAALLPAEILPLLPSSEHRQSPHSHNRTTDPPPLA